MPETLTVRRVIAASRQELFDAWLDQETLGLWMTPGMSSPSTVTLDPRVGGSFSITMHHHGTDYGHTGTYRIIDRPSKLAFTWISEGTHDQETLVTVEFHERPDGTEVVLTHEGLPASEVEGHTEGWTEILRGLDSHAVGR